MNFPNPFRRTNAQKAPIFRYGPGISVKTVPTATTVISSPPTELTYTMAMLDGQNAEITMYGEIVESQPVDYYSGEPVEGSYIIQDEFLEDLKSVAGAKSITIRMNSVGGDAGVSILIHNRLRELSAQGTKLTCVVDGVAMSGGSLIMCACDNVEVNPSSLVMIHKCWSFLFGGYNADELKEMASRNEAWDKAQVSIYKRKSGLSDMVISNMMAKTTYMTGIEAVEKGFADKIIEDAAPLDIAASADGRSLFVRGKPFHLVPGMFVPDNIPTVNPEAKVLDATNTNQPAQTGGQNGGNTMANNLAELQQENPALAQQLMAEAQAAVFASMSAGISAAVPAAPAASVPAASAAPVIPAAPTGQASGSSDTAQAERLRLQEIDKLAGIFDAETINAAKYGEHPCTAQEMVYQAAQKAAQQGRNFLAALEADTAASGAQEVGAANNTGSDEPNGKDSPQAMLAQAKADAKAYNNRRKEIR